MTPAELTPQVRGKLADTEARIIAIIAAGEGESFRTTIAIDPVVALAAVRAADREDRDFSNFCLRALQAYCERHGPPPAETVERLGRLTAALTANPALGPELDRLLAKNTRVRRGRQPVAA